METKKQVQSINEILDTKIREYNKILEKKKELEDQTKSNNATKEKMEQEIAQIMVDNEKPSTIVDGYTYSLQETKMYSKKAEEKLEQLKEEEGIEFFEVLREQGLGSIIKENVNAKTLQSTMKAFEEELPDGEGLPEELEKCLNIYSKIGIYKAKASKKALQALNRAKKAQEV
jgi:vacuolar-type H+-ATPase subunit I/STV1